MTETINLNEIRWVIARGNGKWVLPFDGLVSSCLSKPHKTKACADDLTVVSSSRDHCQALLEISNSVQILTWPSNHLKCVSLVYDGKRVDSRLRQNKKHLWIDQIPGSNTESLSTLHSTWGWEIFLQEFERQIHNLDCSPIQGEYKLWIYKRFMVPAFHFSLAVDAIPNSILRKMQMPPEE